MESSCRRLLLHHLIGLGLGPGLLLSACGQGEELAAPDNTSALEIITVTRGGGTDPDGYAVRIDNAPELPVNGLDTLLQTGLVVGDYQVALSGVAETCEVEGSNPRPVALEPRKTAQVVFDVACVPPPPAPPPAVTGSIEVTVTTTGSNIDSDGYVVILEGASATVPANGVVTFSDVTVGDQAVELSGIAENCALNGPFLIVSVEEAQTAHVTYSVTCRAPFRGRLLFSRGRSPTGSSFLITQKADGTSLGVPLTSGVARAPAYSPDGKRIAYVGSMGGAVVEPHIVTMNADGSEPVEWRDCSASAARPVFSPDGVYLLCLFPSPIGSTLYRLRLDQTDSLQLTPDSLNVLSATWSRDGRSIALTVTGPPEARAGIYLVNPDGSGLTMIHRAPEGFVTGTPVWSPDGSGLLFEEASFLIDLNLARRTADTLFNFPLPEPSPRPGPPPGAAPGPTVEYAWSPDGTRIAVISGDITIFAVDGSPPTEPPPLPQADMGATGSPSWSPDGSMVALMVEQSEGGALVSRIFLVNANGTGLTQLTASSTDRYDADPVWQP